MKKKLDKDSLNLSLKVVIVVTIVMNSEVKKEEGDFMGTTNSNEVSKLMKDRLKVINFPVNKIVRSMMETTQNYFHNSE